MSEPDLIMKREPAPVSEKKQRILIVEDQPLMLELLSTVLQEAGYEVDQAEHALAAVCAVVRAAPPDLILTDIRMPIVDGLELVRTIKADTGARHIPIVAVTGLDTPQAREAAHKAGCIGYITKPIDVKRFPQQIAQFLYQPKSQAHEHPSVNQAHWRAAQ